MKDIKPIETSFRGHLFRSRLEARWAVFFTSIELEYRYEPEGFELGDGLRYLPDFYLPALDLFVEVKPNRDISVHDLRKMVTLATDGGKSLLLLAGSPGEKVCARLLNRAVLPMWFEIATADAEETAAAFWETVDEWGAVRFAGLPNQKGWHLVYLQDPPNEAASLQGALADAKAARFEFGRSGN